VSDFFVQVRQMTAGLASNLIFNMDETPCFYDMTHGRTLHFRGEKAVDGLDSGHCKDRFTTVLCISAAGTIIRSLVILKGLKKIPKVTLPRHIDLAVNMSGSMTTDLICYGGSGTVFLKEVTSLRTRSRYFSWTPIAVIRNKKSRMD
jgi:hypothetical protein